MMEMNAERKNNEGEKAGREVGGVERERKVNCEWIRDN